MSATHPDLDALLNDDALLGAAVAAAQRDAVRLHRMLGQPVVVWRDGRVVEEFAADGNPPPDGASDTAPAAPTRP